MKLECPHCGDAFTSFRMTVVMFLIGLLTLSGCAPSKDQQAVDAYNRGIDYCNKGEFDKAIANYTEAIRIDPNDGVAYFCRGLAYQKKFVFYKAEADFAKAKELGYQPE